MKLSDRKRLAREGVDVELSEWPVIPTHKERRDWRAALVAAASHLGTLVSVVEAADAPTPEAESIVDAAVVAIDGLSRMLRVAAEGRDVLGIIAHDRERRGRPPGRPNAKGERPGEPRQEWDAVKRPGVDVHRECYCPECKPKTAARSRKR